MKPSCTARVLHVYDTAVYKGRLKAWTAINQWVSLNVVSQKHCFSDSESRFTMHNLASGLIKHPSIASGLLMKCIVYEYIIWIAVFRYPPCRVSILLHLLASLTIL